MPTPAVAFITKNMRADAGVVISASHNAYHDNGIKIFARDGFKLPDEKELELEQILEDEKVGAIRPTKESVGKAFRIDDARGRYIVSLKSVLPADLDLEGLKIVIDCANGAAYKVAPKVLEELGAEVIAIGVSPDGRNINAGCGALHPEAMAEVVKDKGADLGIALDGDADRLIVVDEQGQTVNGDSLLAISTKYMLDTGSLQGKTLVTTVMSNLALDRTVESWGGNVVRTPVGDRYVVEAMRGGPFNLGGEQSGHLVYLDHATTGDGMVGALKFMTALKRSGSKLSELASVLTPFPHALINVGVQRKTPIEELPSVQSIISDVESQLGDKGRVMVRFSGTEPKARVLVEGPDEEAVNSWATQIAGSLGDALG
jgi:phosphoglucosamine mutase